MSCDICGRQHHTQRLPFLCPVDARNQLYEGRVAHAVALMDAEELENKVNALLSLASSSTPSTAGATAAFRKIAVDAWSSERLQLVDRTNEIIAHADRLRAEVLAARREIESRKESLSRRKAQLTAATEGQAARRAKPLEDVERSISDIQFRWDDEHGRLSATRSFLCMEAARLYGLRRLRKGGSVRYEIAGIEIVDLQSMGSSSPEVISTCLAHLTHILMLASHYLSIRLPAEITLPHRNYPRPTIFSLASSYSDHAEVPFPGSSNVSSQVPFASPGDEHRQKLPRARPLFVDKPLQILAKEDPSTYSLFVEGVALLAYDIAWVCCSQGVPIGDRSSFEDVCNMGRNLYSLLIGTQLHSNPAGRMFPVQSASSPGDHHSVGGGETDKMIKPGGGATTPAAAQMMGRFSHGTAHSFLGGAEGLDFVRSFKLPNPIKLADSLRNKLSSESSVPDWELLEDDAWTVTEGHVDGRRQMD